MKNIKKTEEILVEFEDAADKQVEATEQGNYKLGNRCYDKIILAVNFLKRKDEIRLLYPLLHHNSIGVRMWAASYLLPMYPIESVEILEQIASQSGIRAFTAKIILEEWEKGTLKF